MLQGYSSEFSPAPVIADEIIDLPVELVPTRRCEIIDVRSRFTPEHAIALTGYPHCLYWSSHTTAGFVDRRLVSSLGLSGISGYVNAFQAFFPEGAGYRHDRLDERADLSPVRRTVESRNGDAHLRFIASGLHSCVRRPNRSDERVLFVDLDGLVNGRARRRGLRVIPFTEEVVVARRRLHVPVSTRSVDIVNLRTPALGILQELESFVALCGVTKGRLRLSLNDTERDAGLIVNDYEPLLMHRDLIDALNNPRRFAGGAPLLSPASVFRIPRSISLLVSDYDAQQSVIVEGADQTPILVQWQASASRTRTMEVTLSELR